MKFDSWFWGNICTFFYNNSKEFDIEMFKNAAILNDSILLDANREINHKVIKYNLLNMQWNHEITIINKLYIY